jgi:hypothetical protein
MAQTFYLDIPILPASIMTVNLQQPTNEHIIKQSHPLLARQISSGEEVEGESEKKTPYLVPR